MDINSVSSSNRRQIHILKECIENLQESNRTLQSHIENVESLLTEFIKKQRENIYYDQSPISYNQGYKLVEQKSSEEDSKLVEKDSRTTDGEYKVPVSNGNMSSISSLFKLSFSKEDLSFCGKGPRPLFEQYEIYGRKTFFPPRRKSRGKRIQSTSCKP